jgi:hypothetical protein
LGWLYQTPIAVAAGLLAVGISTIYIYLERFLALMV